MRSPAYPSFSVTLVVDGAALQEYVHGDDAGDVNPLSGVQSVVRYVEAVPGANFSVDACLDPHPTSSDYDLAMFIYLDGVSATGTFLTKEWEKSVKGVEEQMQGQWKLKRFCFAEFKRTEDMPTPDLKQELARLGEVTLVVFKCRCVGPSQNTSLPFKPAVDSTVPEKALKGRAISTHIKLDNAVPCQPMTYFKIEYPWGNKPLAVFTFKHRSRSDLQIEGLLPRDDTPTSEQPSEQRSEHLTLDQAKRRIQQLEARLGTQSEAGPSIKREKRRHSTVDVEGSDEDNEVVEVSRTRKRCRTSRDSSVEIIDLSGD